jgi:exodeoxyribonuclease VII large subunit
MNERSSGPPDPGQGSLLFSDPAPAEAPADQPAEGRRTWAVGELVRVVRQHIERDYADVWVEGEISNLRSAPSGHKYFTLKDGEAQLPVVLFKRQAQLMRSQPRDGLHVRVRGKVTVYEQRGQMQLVAETLEGLGTGSLQEAFEKLKIKLGAEGLFAAERKKPLPEFPRCVGIVTSPSGAVIRDFLNVTSRRHAALDVLLYPAVVQGDAAAAEIAAGILHFNRAKTVDVIVIARGGGSIEDLAPFNNEMLARVIASSELPIVSAVGHETDFAIADFVADLRAPTPSAAAELITAQQHRVEERVEELRQRLLRACRYQLMMASERFSRVSIAAASARLRDGLGRRQQRLDELQFRMEAAIRQRERGAMVAAQELSARLMRHEPTQRLRADRENVNGLERRLFRCAVTALESRQSQLKSADGRLASLSPLSVLGRGYAVIFDENGSLVRDAASLRRGETLTSRLAQGLVTSTVTDTTI